MDPFTLPDVLPSSTEELAALRAQADAVFAALKAKVENKEDLADDELAQLRVAVEALDKIDEAVEALAAADQTRRDEAANLVNARADKGETEESEESEETEETEGDDAVEGDVLEASGKIAKRKTSFSGIGDKNPKIPAPVKDKVSLGWRMEPNTFGYKGGLVGFSDMAQAVDSVRQGSRARSNRPARGEFAAQTIGRLDREMVEVTDSHELVAAINRATDESLLEGGSLTAAGGWCAPSEQLYDFCEVQNAIDLISLPEIAIKRGGVRWPIEPDLTAIFESFQFFFTEPELEAVDAEGNPTAFKQCIEIPCPDEFEELRLNAVGYCVEAGILQTQGWPELIEWFMRSLTAEHFRAISRRTVADMVKGSTSVVIPENSQIAAGSSVLNSLDLMATNLRIDKGLGRTATIEGVAPVWLHNLIRADLANQQGVETKNVTDSQITSWLTGRNIALQYVGDWQTRSAGLPGNLQTVRYPANVFVMLYPAGTWFRSLSNVIELGVMYPKEQLQVNRYTRFFTEDAIAVGKRCNASILVEIPINPNGAFGVQKEITAGVKQVIAPPIPVLPVQPPVTPPVGG